MGDHGPGIFPVLKGASISSVRLTPQRSRSERRAGGAGGGKTPKGLVGYIAIASERDCERDLVGIARGGSMACEADMVATAAD